MTAHRPIGLGIIGAGMISSAYLDSLTTFPDVLVHAVGDLDVERAQQQAAAYGIEEAGDSNAVLEHRDVDIVVNLTLPRAHAEVSEQAIAHGKHVWSEKPISTDFDAAAQLLERADSAGLRVGVAPDTVLGPGMQTARRLLAEGIIGRPLSASTTMKYGGPERMHPAPEFLYSRGAGPLYDMGPYYVTALVSVFGPIARVSAVGTRARSERSVRVGPRAGRTFPVDVPTHVNALFEFASGQVAESTFSFDSPIVRNGIVEITGTEGVLTIPDPNKFTGRISVTHPPAGTEWPPQEHWVDHEAEGSVTGRGLGVLDLARAIREGRAHAASGRLALHVLDALISVEKAIAERRSVALTSTVEEIPLLPEGFDPHASTLR